MLYYITFVYRVRGLHNAVISLVGKGLVGQKLGLTTDVAQKQYSEARVGETAFDWLIQSVFFGKFVQVSHWQICFLSTLNAA